MIPNQIVMTPARAAHYIVLLKFCGFRANIAIKTKQSAVIFVFIGKDPVQLNTPYDVGHFLMKQGEVKE